ncbi:hypothetical protein AB7M45_007834 [Bradyrhizobium elkanii]|uniref:hypothetical protein n=1 Tax=Bradyrhizobium elkanii TaxID=29448 RepID=UPI000A9248E3|nr:hypothetical protein [Bradyrhizobium elkanii]MCW2195061.1 hypothetical protein [Bradyrhizobium elkanii]NWL67246.1 hypothetical protein [Bradyrhizobium elkanii]
MSDRFTSEEMHLLKQLQNGPQRDRDRIPERVLVNSGMARRADSGMIEITNAGRAWMDLPDVGEELGRARASIHSFDRFKAGDPARSIFRKMGLLEYLDAAQSWGQLRALIVRFNDPDKGHFVKRAKQCDGVCSSGERVLLHAILYVTDFAWLADKLGGKEVWQNMNRAGGEHRAAVAACIGAEVY